jgi:LPXTG-motif cell wall-anchored protein
MRGFAAMLVVFASSTLAVASSASALADDCGTSPSGTQQCDYYMHDGGTNTITDAGSTDVSPTVAGSGDIITVTATNYIDGYFNSFGTAGVETVTSSVGGYGTVISYSPAASATMTVNASGGSVQWKAIETATKGTCPADVFAHCDGTPTGSFTAGETFTMQVKLAPIVGSSPSGGFLQAFGSHWTSSAGEGGSYSDPIQMRYGPAKPTAAFDANRNGQVPGQYQFVSNSTDPDGLALDQVWDLGDGTTANGPAVTHAYTKPGAYHVTLTVTDTAGQVGSASRDLIVAAPTLNVTPLVVGGSADVAPGDAVNVDVQISASADGVGNLTGLQWDPNTPTGLSSSPSDAVTLTGTPTLPSSLAPGQTVLMHFTLTAGTHIVTAALTSSLDATDAGGTAVSASGSVNLKISLHALTVTVTAATTPVVLAIDPDGVPIPADVAVTIVVRNTSANPVDSVTVAPLDLAAADPTHPYAPFPATVLNPNTTQSVGTLAAGTSTTINRTVRFTDFGSLLASALVTSSSDTVLGQGALKAGLPDLGLTWAMDPRWDGSVSTIISTPEQLTPDSWGFTVTATAGCGHTDSGNMSFTIDGVAPTALTHDPGSCTFHFTRPNLDKFTISAALTRSGLVGATSTTDIAGRDFFIVAVGDSLSSGEGLPASTWSVAQCHRSVTSGSGLAALTLERSDPHTAVDYASLACSGASTDIGLIGPYVGIQPGSSLPPQLVQLQGFAATRAIDSVVFSTGANDLQFGDVVKVCLFSPASGCGPTSTVLGQPAAQFLNGLFALLPADYGTISQYLTASAVPATRVIALTYPDSTHSDLPGNPYCGYTNGSDFTMTSNSWQYLHDNILLPLNQAVATAASTYSWKLVGTAEAAFLDHGYCSSDPWITTITSSLETEALVPNGGFHPNGAGYDWYGEQIYGQLQSMLYVNGQPVAVSNPGPVTPIVASTGTVAFTAAPGSSVAVTGEGFAVGEPVDITLHSTPVLLSTVNADGAGRVRTTVTIPADTEPGQHELILSGHYSGNTVSIPITVTAVALTAQSGIQTSSALAATGEPANPILMVSGVSALLAGAALWMAGRRRRET